MPATVDGSPTHVLIVHVVVVLLPLSVLGALLLVAIPAMRRAYGLLVLAVAFVACMAIPFAFLSGSALRRQLPPSPLIDRHVQLAHELLPLAAVFGLALAAYVFIDMLRRARHGRLNTVERRAFDVAPGARRWAEAHRLRAAHGVAASLVVVLALGTGVQIYRVGDAGAKAAWSGRLNSSLPNVSP